MNEGHLKVLARNARRFFGEFRVANLKNLSDAHIQNCIATHALDPESLRYKYSRQVPQR
jgi:hypothetical protein